MRVCVVSNLYPPDVLGGYELLAEDVVTALRRCGHRVDVLCAGEGTSGEGVFRMLKLAVPFGRACGRERLRHTWIARHNRRAVLRYVRRYDKPDAVLAMSQRRLGVEPLRVLSRLGVPIVATVNDDWPLAFGARKAVTVRGAAGSLLDRTIFRRATWHDVRLDRVVCVSRAMQSMVDEAGLPFRSSRVQPQGVDVSVFSARAHREMGRPVRLLWVGRLAPEKSPELALDTLALLGARGLDARLDVVGACASVAYERALRRRVEEQGLAPRLTFHGFVPRERLPGIYRAADVFLFTSVSEREGQGLTYLEAMACGVPVVAHAAGGARDLLEQPGVAFLAPSPTAACFADTIAGLVLSDARIRATVSFAAELLKREASLERYVDVLESELVDVARALR